MFLLFLMCWAISGCGYLIQPKVKEGVVNIAPGSYQIDPQHTSVLFKLQHMGMSTFVGRFNQVEASLEFDPQHMEQAKLTAAIAIPGLDVNNPVLAQTLLGSDWFDATRYPQAVFTTTSVTVIDAKHAAFTGDLRLHGVTAPIVLDVFFQGSGDNLLTGRYTLGFEAYAHFKRSAFGIDYLIPAIGDDIRIEVFAEFQKR
jgi:polyisoprenoid-binding protein YceI